MIKKNILITGSEGLIGKSLVKHFKKLKSNVFKIDIKKKTEKNYTACDITNEDEVKECIGNISKRHKIDVLINNATFTKHAFSKKSKPFKFSDYKLDDWKNNIEVDLIGSFLVSKYVCKQFEKKGKGNIINISSIYGITGPDQEIYSKKKLKKYYGYKPVEYSISKAGLIGFTKSLSAFYKKTDIRVNCVALGGIKTKKMDSFFLKNYYSKTISNKMASVKDYSELISFLASDNSKYINGSCIVADGGATSII